MRVLVVDDDELVAAAYRRLLARRGATTVSANGIASARALVQATEQPIESETTLPFDVILSDVDMPDGTGFDLVEWLQAHKYPVKMLLMSADTFSPERRARAKKLGVRLLDKATQQSEILDEVVALAAIKVCW